MPGLSDIVSAFLRDAQIEMACEPPCSFCSHINEGESIERGWEVFLERARQAECPTARRTQAVTRGSLVLIRNMCFRCQTSAHRVTCAYGEMRVEDINGVVNVDRLGVYHRGVRCDIHSKKTTIRSFGEIPRYLVVKTSLEWEGENRSLPLRLYRRSNEEPCPVGYVDDPASTFLQSFLYVPNPCYAECWAGGVTASVWIHEGEEGNKFLLVRVDGPEMDHRMWTLKEVFESKPFTTASGPFKIASTICVQGRRWDFHDLVLFPPQKDRATEEGEDVEGHIVRHDVRRRVIASLDEPGDDGTGGGGEEGDGGHEGVSGQEEQMEDDGQEGEGGQDGERDQIEAVNRSHPVCLQGNIPLPLTESHPDILGSIGTSKIPFLFASLPYLLNIGYRNHHYDDIERVGRIGLEDARRKLESNETGLFVSGLRGSELLRMSLNEDAIDRPPFSSLKLFCDVDSMDIVTHPWGGMVFRGGLMKIYTHFKGGTWTKDAINQLNDKNDLTMLKPCDEDTYPGTCFVYIRGGPRQHITRNEEDLDPIGLKMFEMKSNLCMDNLIVRAIVPTWSVSMAFAGQKSLLKLFAKYVRNGGAETGDAERCGLSNRQLVARFFWYLIREMLYFSLSLFSRNVCYPVSREELACCAIPTETNGHRHDRQAGMGSNFRGGVVVESEEMVIAFQILCRFFRALEDHAAVPIEQRSFPSTESEDCRYEVGSELLDRIEDESLQECLRSDLGDGYCAEYFEHDVWKGMKMFNGMLVLRSDENRRGMMALPNEVSNVNSLAQGHMVLEDLLILAPVVFRLVRHGMKRSFHSSESGELTKKRLLEEFSLSMIQDGVMDVAFNLEGPSKSGVAVVLPTWTVQKTRLLFPCDESNRSVRNLRGCLYTARGYPETLGLSTSRGRAGFPNTGLQEEGIRKLKAYSTIRSMESNRGQTVYDGAANALKNSMRNFTALIDDWKNLRSNNDRQTRDKAEKRETRRLNNFETLLHDVERRELAVKNDDTFGVRIELTGACKRGLDILNAAIHLLRIQEKKMAMGNLEFERCYIDNPEQWPWFLNIPSRGVGPYKAAGHFDICTIPVTLVPCKEFIQFNITVERELLMTAFSWYNLSRAWVSHHALPRVDGRTEMYLHFLRELPHGKSISLGMLACRAFLSSANRFVNSITCMEEDISPHMPSFLESALGLDISYYETGIPQVITSRFVANGGPLMWVMTNRSSGSGRLLTELSESSRSVEQAAYDLDNEIEMPERLSFQCRRKSHGYSMQVIGTAFQEGISADMFERRTLMHILHAMFFIPNESDAKSTLRSMAAFVVALLVCDCVNELRKNLGRSSNDQLHSSEIRREHAWRMKPKFSVEDCQMLGRNAREGTGWQRKFRIDVCGIEAEDEEPTFHERMNGLLSFYGGDVYGRTCLTEWEGTEYCNEVTDDMGRLEIDKFLQLLWRRGQMVTQEEHVVTTEWKSILCLRAVGMLANENGETDVLHFEDEVEFSIPFRIMFEREFPKIMKGCLDSAGFMNLSPVLTPSILGCEMRRIWSTTPIFSYIYDDERQLTPFGSRDIDGANVRATIFRRSFVSCLRFILTYKLQLEQLEELEREEGPEEQGQAQMYMERLSKQFWKREVVQELALLCLQETRKDARFTSISKESFDYCLLVLECLIDIRRELIDEGIAAVMDVNGYLRSVREVIFESFPPIGEWFKNPWKTLNYPKPTLTRDGKITKKVVVRESSLLLFESGLVFKTALPSRPARNAMSHIDISDMSVGEIYERYGEASERGVIGSHSMWRLAPDNVIISTLERACRKGAKNN